jgi:hypothetical protein
LASTLPQLFDAIYQALAPLSAQIEGLNVYPNWEDTPTPPALDIYPSTPFMTGTGFMPGGNMVFVTVRARASTADPAAAQETLLRLMEVEDPASVEYALINIATVTEGGVSGFTTYADDGPVNERMLGCEWRLVTILEDV